MTKCRLFVLIPLFSLALLLNGCGNSEQTPENPKVPRPVKTLVIGEVQKLQNKEYPGKVVGSQKVDLAFQVSGRIIELPAQEGKQVKENDLLVKLDPKDFDIALKEAQANLDKAEADFKRAKQLIESHTISQSQFEEIQSKYTVMHSKVEAAQKALEDSELKAPFTGVITKTYVQNFQNIQAKEKILSLQDITQIDVLIHLPEQDLLFAQRREIGSKIETLTLQFDALPNRQFDVYLKEFAAQADPLTGTYEITLTTKAPEDVNLLPGMSATVILHKPTDLQIVYLPLPAVRVNAAGNHFVWLIDGTLTVHERLVVIGDLDNNRIEIRSGLSPNDRVVIAGSSQLQEGLKVRLWDEKRD